VLNPGVEAAAARDFEREKSKRHAVRHGEPLAARWAYLQDELEELRSVGLWIDSAPLTVEETAEAILEGRDVTLIEHA
jgi:hypothetical protein